MAQRALSLFNRGSYNGAIAEYSKAISMEPSNAALFHNRGLGGVQADRYDAAFADSIRQFHWSRTMRGFTTPGEEFRC